MARADRPANTADAKGLGEVRITPEMVAAGEERLDQLTEASSAYVVSEVYLAMVLASRVPSKATASSRT